MTPLRRYLSMAMGALTIVLLGYVAAVAARSRPGNSAEDPLFEMNSRLDLDLGRIVAWIVIVMAVLGFVLFALGVKQAKPKETRKKRSYLGLILGVIAFALIFRYVRPLADTLLNPEQVSGSEEAVDRVAPGPSGSSGWLFSLLVAAIVAAALTRVGLAVRDGDPSFEPEVAASEAPTGEPVSRRAATNLLPRGSDPRSRILDAYSLFEDSAGSTGLTRKVTETANRHAARVARDLDLDPLDVSGLLRQYARARFGFLAQDEADAAEAEESAQRLVRAMES